jgi:SRSO17 transposase
VQQNDKRSRRLAMILLEHPDAQALLEDAVLTPDQLEDCATHIEPFLALYFSLFQRAEQRDNARLILMGKLSALSRKTCEPIAHSLGVRRENLQSLVGCSPWSDRPILDQLHRLVAEAWGDSQGVLIGDGSGFPKKGEHFCGVTPPYCGRLGKVDNCQVGIFVGYACRHGHTLLEHQLFLPPEWACDPVRRVKAGVPEGVVYKETWEILLDELERCRDVPHAWLSCDSEFGRVNALRAGLRQRGERYVVGVRENLRVRDLRERPPLRRGATGRLPVAATRSAKEWADRQAADAWQMFAIRGGDKGPLVVEAVQTPVLTFEDTALGCVERLVVIRTVGAEEIRTWYCLSNAADEVPLGEVVWAHGQRYWAKAGFAEGKGEVGLGHYEVGGWVGWHDHMTLSLLALWFLALERDREAAKTAR